MHLAGFRGGSIGIFILFELSDVAGQKDATLKNRAEY